MLYFSSVTFILFLFRFRIFCFHYSGGPLFNRSSFFDMHVRIQPTNQINALEDFPRVRRGRLVGGAPSGWSGLVEVRVSTVLRKGRPARLLSRLSLPSTLWQPPLQRARSRGHSRRVAAGVFFLGCRDHACRISRSAASGRIAPISREYALYLAAVSLPCTAI